MAELQKLELSDDKELLDVELIHTFLSEQSDWNKGISLKRVITALENSLCIGAYLGEQQVAFCRVVTDYATFANLMDVFVVPEFRGNGISKALMRFTLDHPLLQNFRRFSLTTSDCHGLYAQFGFVETKNPERYMEIYRPDLYQTLQES